MSVITKKPRRNAKPTTPKLSEDQIAQLISKGGDVPAADAATTTAPVRKKADKKVSVQLRLPQSLINTIDGLLDQRIVDVPRHTWFLEAIEAKIRSERSAE